MSVRACLLAIAAFVIAAPVFAAEPPACNRPAMGQVGCIDGRLCKCLYDHGGTVTGVPPGFRWDCSILRPRCGDAAAPPTSVQEYRGQPPALPLAVGIDRSNNSVNVGE